MSPLGILDILNSKKGSHYYPNHNSSHYYSDSIHQKNNILCRKNRITQNISTSFNNDPLLRLMSISLANDSGPVALNLKNSNTFLPSSSGEFLSQNCITSKSTINREEMLLKSGHLPGGSPIPIPSPNSSGSGHPESPKSATTDPGITHRLTPPDSYSCTKSCPDSCTNNNSKNIISTTATNNTTTTTPGNDEDEVLSIGRDDDLDHQQMLMDCDSSVISDGEEEIPSRMDVKEGAKGGKANFNKINNRNNNHEEKDCPNEHNNEGESHSQIGSEQDYEDDRLSQNSSEMELGLSLGSLRNRKYSSEDSFTIKSLCSPTPNYHHNNNSNETTTTVSPPPSLLNGVNNNNNNHHHHFRHNSSSSNPPNNPSSSNGHGTTSGTSSSTSLLFSIANILRPDFGLGTASGIAANSNPFIPHKNLKSPPITDFNYKHHPHYNSNNNQSSSNKSLLNNKKHQQTGLLNPIDLSRPTPTSISHNYQINHLLQLQQQPISISKNHPISNGHSLHSNGHSTKQKLKINHESNKSSKNEQKISKSNTSSSSNSPTKESSKEKDEKNLWPAWVYCTRYSDRPSSGPRARRTRKEKEKEVDEKRPRTAFTAEQLARLKKEFDENRYLTEKRRQDLAKELRLHENQIKIWFQNKRAKLKKATGTRGGLALQLMAQGLYNHSTIPRSGDDDSD